MPNGKGVETLSTNVSEELAATINALAFECGLSRSKYILALLQDAAAKRRKFVLRSGAFVEDLAPTHYRLNEKKPSSPPARVVRPLSTG